jgi:hypothetical protein
VHLRGPPGHRDRSRRQQDGEQHFGTALLEPATALSIANAILAAVEQVISTSDLDETVAEILVGMDMDSALSDLLGEGAA